jgi:hypothetical protein
MKAFVIFALIAVAAARPDIGIQLQQQGGGFGNFGSSSGGYSGAGGYAGGSSGGSFGAGGGGGLTQGQTQVIDISSGGSSGSVVYKPVVKQGPPQISKSFYVHEAPEEAANVEVREKEILVRPQKHYKIIFIKAPSGGSSVAGGSAAIFPQSEEKTIVYVLSRKPEGITEDGDIPSPPAPVTTKPEVFFVKYKTQQEADGAISNIQESFKEGGAGYNNPAGFAQSLGASSGSASSSSFTGPIGRSDFGVASQAVQSNQAPTSYVGGQDSGSFNGFSAQQMVEIPVDSSAFRSYGK